MFRDPYLLRELLRVAGTTEGIPKRLSTDKYLRQTIDNLYTKSIEQKKCEFLTDAGKGCRKIEVNSLLDQTCRQYCLEDKDIAQDVIRLINVIQKGGPISIQIPEDQEKMCAQHLDSPRLFFLWEGLDIMKVIPVASQLTLIRDPCALQKLPSTFKEIFFKDIKWDQQSHIFVFSERKQKEFLSKLIRGWLSIPGTSIRLEPEVSRKMSKEVQDPNWDPECDDTLRGTYRARMLHSDSTTHEFPLLFRDTDTPSSLLFEVVRKIQDQ